jgi:hypothetical protein
MDLYGFVNNLWIPIELYQINNYSDPYNILIKVLKIYTKEWDIRWYDKDIMYIFQLTRKIFQY